MQTVVFCGGKGTRLKEETEFKPKPMVEIGGRPILWHIMKIYSHYGHNEFILPLGYKGGMIKEHFSGNPDKFKITFANTGLESLTGERLMKVKKFITNDDFMVTYGDGVSDIDIGRLLSFHKKQGTIATITGVHPYSKYGLVQINKKTSLATEFRQKPLVEFENEFVGGGFMVFNKKIFSYLDDGSLETVFPKLIRRKQLSVYRHKGFWMAMDTYLEMAQLNKLWRESKPWAVWMN